MTSPSCLTRTMYIILHGYINHHLSASDTSILLHIPLHLGEPCCISAYIVTDWGQDMEENMRSTWWSLEYIESTNVFFWLIWIEMYLYNIQLKYKSYYCCSIFDDLEFRTILGIFCPPGTPQNMTWKTEILSNSCLAFLPSHGVLLIPTIGCQHHES